VESLVYEAAGAKVLSMHHDISTVTGEEVIVFFIGWSAALHVIRQGTMRPDLTHLSERARSEAQ